MHDSKDESLIEVTVADTGIGMTQEELQRIFVPFNTTDNRVSRSLNPRGHGVGLSICKQICRNLGGDITVKSQPNVGSTFKMTMKVYSVNKLVNRSKNS